MKPLRLPRFSFPLLLFCVPFAVMALGDERKDHAPLPGPEELSQLPADGGPEFNRLVFEKSPYLLQHARNPVDWWPWSEEAFARAAEENKPVFLSVGYSTCHWCHVMARESFEDPEVAELINEYFIPVKVDREERPDIDEVYMQITQAVTGSGGWPMTVVMTPEGDAFFAGTYFPRESVAGRPGIKRVAAEMHRVWTEEQDEVISTAKGISKQLAEVVGASPGGELDPTLFDQAFEGFAKRFDPEKGGFARRPKFPVPPNLMFLLRYHHRTGNERALEMVEKTLTEMRRGGIYDHIGFGFHRYSTDPDWLLPHFEKMLYDQALIAMAYLEAYQVTGEELYERTAREILSYVQRDMTSPEGGFYSAEDAESEGVEGRFYVWSTKEIEETLDPEEAEFVLERFRFEEEGNFLEEATRERNGTNIPHLASELSAEEEERFAGIRGKLFAAREARVHPRKDDKILTDWNGLMIAAFARASQVTGDAGYAETARKAADFVLEKLTDESGRLLKRYRGGEAGLSAHLEDYAFMIWGLLDLYEAGFDPRHLDQAIQFQEFLDELFWDEEAGGYFTVADDSEALIVRAKKLYGGAIPSGNAVSIGNLARLYRLTGNPRYATRGDELIRAFSGELARTPSAYPLYLTFLDLHLGPAFEVVISGEGAEEMLAALRRPFLPNKVVLHRTGETETALAAMAPFTQAQLPLDGAPTAYVCRDFACQLPTKDIAVMLESLGVPTNDQ